MSATYRIDVSYEPSAPNDPIGWIARIVDILTGVQTDFRWAGTAVEAAQSARQTIAASPPRTQSIYVDDLGRDAEAPQSVKVPE